MKYVNCDCGHKVKVGSKVYRIKGSCIAYCSAECYANNEAHIVTMDEYEADNCFKEVIEE